MFKKAISLFLACLLTLSLAACGGKAPEAPAAAQVPVPETTEATTAPTLSPEEQLIASLPEKVRQAYDLGLVKLELLEDLDRICLGAEAAEIVQNIHIRHHGKESKIMSQLLQSDHADLEVTRYWLAQTMFVAEAEFLKEPPFEDYLKNVDYMLHVDDFETLPGYLDYDGYAVHTNDKICYFYKYFEPDALISSGYIMMPDRDELEWNPDLGISQEMYVNCSTEPRNVFWATFAFDRLTGEKIITANENVPFLPREKMTVWEVVETTLRYNNWIPPLPEMLPYDEIPTYDTSIITDALLNKETTLPEASCQNLPASWRGMGTKILLSTGESDVVADRMLQKNEIQIIKEAGFNFLRLNLDFRYYTSDAYNSFYWQTNKKGGYMNESRLKELDQIIAYCMEKDIHVNLACKNKVVGWSDQATPPAIFAAPKNAVPLAEQWQVLARRYAAIPNTYLSFTMFDEPDIWQPKQYGRFFTPVVEAIREVSPDRCIIADMEGRDAGEDMAALGVALSTQAVWPEDFHLEFEMKAPARNALFESAT